MNWIIKISISLIAVVAVSSCGPKKLSFSKEEIQTFNNNSKIIQNNVEFFDNVKSKYGYPLISDGAKLDSIIGESDFIFHDKVKSFVLGKDNVIYNLKFKEDNTILLQNHSTYNHYVILAFDDRANMHIDFQGNEIYLIDAGKLNPKWADIWGVLEIVYWRKLDDNLYYYIVEETFL